MKNDKIYHVKNFDELLPFLNKKNLDYKKILNVYSISGQYDKIYELISNITKNKNLDEKNKDIMNYYLCVYYWHENNKYASDKCYYKLDEISKRKIEYGRCNYVNEYNELYDKYFIDDRNYYKDYGVIYYYLYLCNFLRKDIRIDNKLNKRIIKHINRILNKPELSMHDIDYFAAVINISYNYYNIFYKKYVEFPINLELLEKMCDKSSNDIKLYSEMLKNRLIELNEGILLGYRALITLMKDKDRLEELLKKTNEFVKTSELKEYTKFVYNITKDKNSGNVDKYIEEINKIASGEIEGEIIRTIIIYCVKANEKDLRSFYDKIKDIECKNDNKQLIEELNLGKLILRFWLGERINVDQLNDNVYLSDFLRLIMEFDCKKINYQQFIKMLEKVNDVDSELILNWQRLDKIFYNCDYEWLKLILSKCEYVNNKAFNYLFNSYIRIINREDIIEFNQFKELDEIVYKKCNNVNITILSVWIYLNVYNENNTSIIDKLYFILNSKCINLDTKDIQSFAIIMVLHLVYDNIKIDVNLVKKFIEKYCTNKEKSLCLLVLYYVDTSSLTIKDYYKCLNDVASIYSDNYNVNSQLQFSLINLLAAKDLIDKDHINIGVNDTIYIERNKRVVLNVDYNEKFKKYYDLLGVNQKEEISEEREKTTLLETFIVRIYFENIEKFNAGKMILLKQGLDGKQILEELLNVTGYKQNQEIIKQIKNGEIVKQPWLNVYTIHQYMKDIKSEVDFKYSNSINCLLERGKKVIHITSIALLAKIGIIDKIVENDNYYVQGHIFDEFEKMKKNGVQDLVDGILEKEICYDDLISDIYNTLVKLDDKERIEYVTTANTLGLEDPSIINQYDIEILKLLIDYKKVPFMLITEDPFYCKNDPTKNISASTYSLVIDMYVNQIIDSKQLLTITRKLKELNYNLYVKKDIYYYFLNNSDDNNISELIDILNEFN